MIRRMAILAACTWSLLTFGGIETSRASDVEVSDPASAGFSAERLARLPQRMYAMVDDGALAGITTLMSRHGKIVLFDVYGHSDIATDERLQPDTIFRIFSMTKPVTSVAMMILYEQGKWQPDDPLSKYIPEFAGLKVYAGTSDTGEVILEEPEHEPTIAELMTHTAGFTDGFFGDTPVDRAYSEANLFAQPSLDAFIARLAEFPLLDEPGERWEYSVLVDVQGHLQDLSRALVHQVLLER